MRKLILLVVSLLLVWSSTSLADIGNVGSTSQVQYINVGPGANVGIGGTWHSGTVVAGIYNLKVDGVDTDSFCIDLQDNSNTGTRTYNVVELEDAPDPTFGPMYGAKAAALRELLSERWVDGMNNNQAAALQVAVWEVVADYGTAGWGLGVGSFTSSSITTIGALAKTYLDAVNGIVNAVNSWNFVALSNNLYQDYVVRVPVPGTLLLAGLGLVALRRKMRRLV